MFKPFNVHHFVHNNKKCNSHFRGFTAIVFPSLTGAIGEIGVQVAFCSRKDVFCRKTGALEATTKPTVFMNARRVGRYLADAAEQCCANPVDAHDFDYLYKYMV